MSEQLCHTVVSSKHFILSYSEGDALSITQSRHFVLSRRDLVTLMVVRLFLQ